MLLRAAENTVIGGHQARLHVVSARLLVVEHVSTPSSGHPFPPITSNILL